MAFRISNDQQTSSNKFGISHAVDKIIVYTIYLWVVYFMMAVTNYILSVFLCFKAGRSDLRVRYWTKREIERDSLFATNNEQIRNQNAIYLTVAGYQIGYPNMQIAYNNVTWYTTKAVSTGPYHAGCDPVTELTERLTCWCWRLQWAILPPSRPRQVPLTAG